MFLRPQYFVDIAGAFLPTIRQEVFFFSQNHVRSFSACNSRARNGCANFMQENLHARLKKHRFTGEGGVGFFFLGGGEVAILFYWAQGFI